MAIKDLMPWRRGPSRRLGSPSEELRGLAEPFNRFLEDPWVFSGLGEQPRVRLEDDGKEFVVSAVLPGMSKEDVDIELTEETLTLRASRRQVEDQRRHGGRRREETQRSFYHSFSLPAAVQGDKATARFKGDTLEIRVPRVSELRKRRVEID